MDKADAFIVAQTEEDEIALLVDAAMRALQQKQRCYWMQEPMHLSH